MEVAMLNGAMISTVDDDDQPFRESMRKLVMLLGYTVEAFSSAADFLASRFLPETACLIAEVHMLGITGVEIQPNASLASFKFAGFISKKRIPTRALLRAVAIGCRIS
jgi:FixJ family two-component response regulator